jgi:hypothetical protein
MTTQSNKNYPAYRLCFSTKSGVDQNGNDILSFPVEIGAAFTRKETSKGHILKLHMVPQELSQGVLFLVPVAPKSADQPELLDEGASA